MPRSLASSSLPLSPRSFISLAFISSWAAPLACLFLLSHGRRCHTHTHTQQPHQLVKVAIKLMKFQPNQTNSNLILAKSLFLIALFHHTLALTCHVMSCPGLLPSHSVSLSLSLSLATCGAIFGSPPVRSRLLSSGCYPTTSP